MQNSDSKKAHAFLTSKHKELHTLFAKIKEWEELNKLVNLHIHPDFKPYCQVATIAGTKLTMLVANGSVATQMRFQTMDMLRKFKQEPKLQFIETIHYKLSPATMPQKSVKPRQQKMPLLSDSTAEVVRDIANSLEDPQLKAILQKIAGHTRE